VTPSHNPPEDGGFKYDPPSGGPADTTVTAWIEARANQYLVEALKGVQRVPHAKALRAATTHRHDYRTAYVNDLENVIDFDVVRGAGVKVGVDPLGGASVQYWPVIAERYGLDLTVVNTIVDERFAFMTLDWDGRIRMDPSSAYAMQRAIALKDSYDLVVACDTDADRHGIVTPGAGLLPPNHYLTVAIDHLFAQRPNWKRDAGVGKTVVSSATIDRIAAKRGLRLYEVPVGFKWFVEGLGNGSLGFAGEESAGASFLRRDGTVWTTDKDGIVAALLAAEITASAGRDPGELYASLTRELGDPRYDRVEAPASAAQRKRLGALTAQDVTPTTLAGEKVQSVVSEAPGNRAPIGGVKVSAASAWFAVRPSGTEDIYKIYAESFKGEAHLAAVVAEAHAIVNALL
jgi:phosphoglucomutase